MASTLSKKIARLEDLNVDAFAGVIRTARKPWRCTCADHVRRYEVRGTYTSHRPGDSWSSTPARTLADAKDTAEAMRRRGATVSGTPFDKVEILEVPNPNYREGCEGDIPVGTRYLEYLGESAVWESGTRYCASCAVQAWASW